MVTLRVFFLPWIWLAGYQQPYAQIWISEVLADPTAVSDALGEFVEIEIGYDSPPDSFRIAFNGDTVSYPIPADTKRILLCRDTVRERNGGLSCDGTWQGGSLVNSQPLDFTLFDSSESWSFSVPAAKPGISWENRFASEQSLSSFQEAQTSWNQKDKGTPGERNSVDQRALQHDWSVSHFSVERVSSYSIVARVTLQNRGIDRTHATSFRISEDTSWNGAGSTVHFQSESISGDRFETEIPISNLPDQATLVRLDLKADDQNVNNHAQRMVSGPSLSVSEVCFAPPSPQPEWIELRNLRSKAIELSGIELNGKRVLDEGTKLLGPNQFLLLTENREELISHYGELSVPIIEPAGGWKPLRNGGDTLRLHLWDTLFVGELSYQAEDGEGNQGCVARLADRADSLRGLPPTPGYVAPEFVGFHWTLSHPVIDLTSPRPEVYIRVNLPSTETYQLSLYDRLGRHISDICTQCLGSNNHRWSPFEVKGGSPPVGAYLLALRRSSKVYKKSLILAKPL